LPASLSEAGLLALALRERRRLTRSWTGLAQELSKNLSGDQLPISIWKSVLGCLYGYVSDPLDMLRSLLVEWKGMGAYALVSHALLSNPMTYEEQIRAFRKLLGGLSEGQQLRWLRYLRLKNQAGLVRDLAGFLLLSTRHDSKEQDNNTQDELLPENVADRLSKERRFYYLYRLSGQPALAMAALQKIQSILQSWQYGLHVAIATCATMSGDEETRRASLSLLSNSIEPLKTVQSELLFLVEEDDADSLVSEFSGDDVSPLLKLKRAEQLARDGDGLIAAQLAKAAAQEFRYQLNQVEHLSEGVFAFDWGPDLVVKSLVSLELNLEALETAQAILKHRPDDVKIIDLIAQILESLDDLEGAQQYLTLAIALEPDNPVWYRRRARVSEQKGSWHQAMRDYQAVLELMVHPEADDILAFARSSAACNQHSIAVEACRRVLEKYPDHDEACCQLGLSLLALGQPDAAISYLTHATAVSPKNIKAWLALVESYERTNQSQLALETLRSSVIANPDSLDLNCALGIACLKHGLLSEGLSYLQKADANGTFSSEASLYYGKALCALKRYDEAQEVLNRAMHAWPQDVELNYCLGELLVQLGREEEAIPILEKAILPPDTPCDWLILYIQAMLGKDSILFSNRTFDFYQLTNAQHILERIIILDPSHLQVRLWLAEVLAYQENYQSAFEIYTRLAEIAEAV
ncbi:MAG: tetratricopeptide repeat protein, partial [Anaerolineales bacterium]